MSLSKYIQRFRNDEEGVSTINFLILFPFLFLMFLAIFEAGWLATRWMMLERGLDIAAREVRVGNASALSHDARKKSVCEYSSILINCERDMILEVVAMDLNEAYPQNQANCRDRTGRIDPTISVSAGGRNEIMFVRACMIVDPFAPGGGLGLMLPKDDSGGFQMVSYTAFMNEPL